MSGVVTKWLQYPAFLRIIFIILTKKPRILDFQKKNNFITHKSKKKNIKKSDN